MDNDQRIAEIKARAEAATPEPWWVVGKDSWHMEGFPQVEMNTPDGKYFPVHNDADADFIANAREDIPFLLGQLAERDKELKDLQKEVASLAIESIEREKTLARLEAEVMVWAKAEQEGRLVALPCKVGDTVYAPFRKEVKEYKIERVDIKGICFDSEDGAWIFLKHLQDGTVFLTREQAEAALKEAQHE
jgi:hypothetical protein